jgi:hypothetical protein
MALGLGVWVLIPGCATAIRRSWLDCALPIPDEIAYDTWLNGLSHEVGARRVIREPLGYYRRHANTVFQLPASLPVKIGKADAVRALAEIDPRTWWTERALQLGLYIDRVEARAEFWRSIGLAAGAASALSAMKHRRDAIEERIHAWDQPRLRRLLTIGRMLSRRHYRHFGGIRGALKDAVQ